MTGPYAKVNAYLKLHADVSETPWWKLYGGLEIPVGVKVEVLSRVVVSYETTAIDYRLLLAQAESNNSPNLPASPSPGDKATVGDLNADLSWTGGDIDGDSVTYDVYFEADDSTPDVLVSDDQSGLAYDPGTLVANTHYYWQVVAQDEHGATTAGPVWEFTTATGATCPFSLTLQSPQVNDLSVTVDGSVASPCSTITRLNWQWGDGISDDQWFPARHTYEVSGTHLITATAYNDLGDTRIEGVTVTVSYNRQVTHVSINFDDLEEGDLNTQFANQGIIFENTQVLAHMYAVSPPNVIQSADGENPIVIRFPRGATKVSIQIDTDGYGNERQPQMRVFDETGELLAILNFGQGPDRVEYHTDDELIYEVWLGAIYYDGGAFRASDGYDNLECKVLP